MVEQKQLLVVRLGHSVALPTVPEGQSSDTNTQTHQEESLADTLSPFRRYQHRKNSAYQCCTIGHATNMKNLVRKWKRNETLCVLGMDARSEACAFLANGSFVDVARDSINACLTGGRILKLWSSCARMRPHLKHHIVRIITKAGGPFS